MAEALLLLGPTGSGKSALAMELAAHLPVEIVSVDSAQVYRGLDIGSAKPGTAERAAVPHHLIDLRDAAEPYSAADFVRDASAAMAGIRARGRLPLIVGGTMLYAKALRDGLAALPSADAELRARLEAQAARAGWPALHAELARVDPTSAARIAPNDAQRIQRALEVHTLTGVPLAELQRAGAARRRDLALVALVPGDRAALHATLARRFDGMLAAGLLDEVRALRARGDLHADLPALRSVGYRQAWAHLAGETDFPAFRESAIAATRRLAKRQLTWLRTLEPDEVIDPQRETPLPRLLARARGLA